MIKIKKGGISVLLHYKCPSCGGNMAFNVDTGALLCPNCGHEENIETYDEGYIEQVFDQEDAVEYRCDNCGGTVLTDKDTTATSCSFCGAGVVMGDRVIGKLAPAQVIPFSISKEEAQETFKKWAKSGRFTPKSFAFDSRIENITGMYVPYFIYDLHAKVKLDGIGTRVSSYRKGDYIYTETKYYRIIRDFDLYYNKVPADASEKMQDDIMDKVEPYHYDALKVFKTPYLAGYLAEKYTYDAKDLFTRIQSKVHPYANQYLQNTLTSYATITDRNEAIDTKEMTNKYVLFPIWLVSYDYEHEKHTIVMNGQTGKIVGKIPLSFGKMTLWTTGITAACFCALKVIGFISGGVWW